jgi:UDP-N-acetylglucosamine transferase subunit ALG13
MSTCLPGAERPSDFPDDLPFLSDYHCQYGSSANLTVCTWSTGAVGEKGLPSNPFELASRIFANPRRDNTSLVAGTSLLEAFLSHPNGQAWNNDSCTVKSHPITGSVMQARRGSSRLLVVMTPLSDTATLGALRWEEGAT